MKTKLLKQVRKRFEIFHLPNGFISDGTHFNYNLFKLIDNNHTFWDAYAQVKNKTNQRFVYGKSIFDTETECINYLKQTIIKILRSEGHKQRKDKQITKQIKVWYI